jgi:exosortase K
MGVKGVCSVASVDALRFILAPSCFVAELLGGPVLSWQSAVGFVSHEARMVVGVPCAGVSFLVIAWLALYFTRQAAQPRLASKLALIASCLVLAYLAAISANGVRIALAAALHAIDFGPGFVTAERVHRWLGVVVYCAALLGLCAVFERSESKRVGQRYLVPLFLYGGITLGIPLARHALGAIDLGKAGGFGEHATHTLGAAALVFMVAAAGRVLVCALRDRLSS